MTIKRLVLSLLTVWVVMLIGGALLLSWTKPQAQSQLNLYQTDLTLHAAEWQGSVPGAVPPLNPLKDMNFRQEAVKNYQKVRQAAQKDWAQMTPMMPTMPPSPETELDVKLGAAPVQRSPEAARGQLVDELTLKLGILYTQTDQTQQALDLWTDFITAPNAKNSLQQQIHTAEVLVGLWSDPPRLLPDAEDHLQDHLTGWFRYQAMQQLYRLQQRQEDLTQLRTEEQETAEQALLRLAIVSGVPIGGSVLGVAILLNWLIRGWLKQRRLSAAPGAIAPTPPLPPEPLSPDVPSAAVAPDSTEDAPLGGSVMATDNAATGIVSSPSGGLETSRNAGLAGSVLWPVETIWQVMVVWFAAFFGVSLLFPLLVQIIGLKPETFGVRIQAYFALINYGLLVSVGLSILYFSLRSFVTKPLRWFRYRWRSHWLGWGVSGYLAALPLVLIISLINQRLLQEQGGGNPLLEIILQNRNGFTIALLYGMVAILAPFFEETLFRGFLLTSLTRYVTTWQAIGLSAIVFAIAHLNLSDILPLTVLGCVLGFVYTRSRNLLASILLHALWNTGSFLGLIILGSRLS